ncbi:predicted protein [Streptomyces lividans TK24]|uniref:Uncharacterized protein n=1 Tax=Streptomyces lividans 1326 TaxID=1200984 RepID=A0A7U9HA27_STRLI|nr:predicted protein [Streptomyces lividans TK24]EOY46308.1 hypothetical protein SLI_1591 [Streptomyces lividans 1326]
MSGHQHSPCADGSPNLPTGGVVIAGSIAPPVGARQVFSRGAGRRDRSGGPCAADIMSA